jgi:hypothetical protein
MSKETRYRNVIHHRQYPLDVLLRIFSTLLPPFFFNLFMYTHVLLMWKLLRYICEISSSHGGEYEAQNLLGCTAVFLIECRPTFQRCVLPPSSGP